MNQDKIAIVLSPITTHPDDLHYAEPLVTLLINAGYKVNIIDVLSISKDHKNIISDVESKIKDIVNCSSFILCGFALGGAIAQYIAHKFPLMSGLLSISGPSIMSDRLKRNLISILNEVEKNNIENAILLLESFVSSSQKSQLPRKNIPENSTQALDRLKIGFNLIMKLDSKLSLSNINKPTLLIVGENSKLVNLENIFDIDNTHIEKLIIKNAGMRPWVDNPLDFNQTITNYLKKL
tara:strand:- start:3606 stop:4316 length:711 start_codon:yes stop_codon:yes gene_type:complete